MELSRTMKLPLAMWIGALFSGYRQKEETNGQSRFLKWRVALMEEAVHELNLSSATIPISNYGKGEDPYKIEQVHDYMNISFLRPDRHVKAASKATIDLLSSHYREMLLRKFFVNVPYLASWMFAAISLFVAKETVAKFIVVSDGKTVAGHLGDKADIPPAYGGTGKPLTEVGKLV